jgi:hypothetical protein
VTDTSGLLVGVVVHPADIQDRDGAAIVIHALHDLFPWLRHLFADSVYNGLNLREVLAKFGDSTIEIDRTGFRLERNGQRFDKGTALGNAYVTGYSFSSNFPTSRGAFQTIFGGWQMPLW